MKTINHDSFNLPPGCSLEDCEPGEAEDRMQRRFELQDEQADMDMEFERGKEFK